MNTVLKLSILLFLFLGCKRNEERKVEVCGMENIYSTGQSHIYKIYGADKATYAIGTMMNCSKEGLWEEYIYPENELTFKWNYKKNKKDGVYFSYRITGKIATVGYYRDGALSGFLVYFDLNNTVEKVEYWKPIDGMSEASALIYTKTS